MLLKRNYTCRDALNVMLNEPLSPDGLASFKKSLKERCDIELVDNEHIGFSGLDGQNKTVLYGFRNDMNVIAAEFGANKICITKIVAKSISVIENLLLLLSEIGTLDKESEKIKWSFQDVSITRDSENKICNTHEMFFYKSDAICLKVIDGKIRRGKIMPNQFIWWELI